LLAFGLAAAAGMSITGGFSLAWIGWVCALVAVVGFGLAMGALWAGEGASEGLVKAAGSLFVFSLALAVVSLTLGRVRVGDGVLVSRLVAAASLATLATATLLSIALVGEVGDEPYYRATAAVAVLSALGTALIPLLRALRRAV
jgi:hypothetical protein